MDRKGISPLVASVLLIAFTLSIAGIMATWSTSFVRGKTSVITSQAECIGSLDVEVKNYQSGVDGSGNAVANVTLMIRNPKSTISLSDILISLEFPTSPFNQTETVKGLGGDDPLGALGVTGIVVPLSGARCPDRITVVSKTTCPDYPQEKKRSAREIPC